MPGLILETSTERSVVFLMENNRLLYGKELPFGLNNSKYLVPAIHEGLSSTGILASGLKFIAVGVGPGSYTGIRVGAMAAKAIAYAAKIPLIGISTLKGFVPDSDCRFAVLIDAKIAGAYILLGEKKNGQIIYKTEPKAEQLQLLEPLLTSIDVIVTPQNKLLKPKLDALYPDHLWHWQLSSPNPHQMEKLALEAVKKGDFSLDGSLELLYLRKTQAEYEKEGRLEVL